MQRSSTTREPEVDSSPLEPAPQASEAALAANAGEEGYLGPGAVVAGEGARVRVRLEDGAEVAVRMALAFPYRPQAGDELLVIGQDQRYFAIGVLSGAAPRTLEFPGDVELRAVEGRLELHGEKGIELEAPELTLRAKALRTFAKQISERADSAVRIVKGLLTEHLGESQRLVAGEDYTQSQRSVTLAKDVVKIDAKTLQLGH